MIRAQPSEERFQLRGYGEPSPSGRADVVTFPPARRVLRALGALAAVWLLAGLALFIPVAHLILVPGFVLWGVVVAIGRVRVARRALRIHGQCPDCGDAQDFEAGPRWSLPRSFTCRSCRRALRAEPIRAADRQDIPVPDTS